MRICHLPQPLNTPIRLLQITDTHLFANETAQLLGIPTIKSFRAVLKKISSTPLSFDAILATGDISQDHSLASYQHFIQGISQLSPHCYWLPGNHDYQKEMLDAFVDAQFPRFDQILLGEHWQLVMFDSQVVGKAYGWLANDQLSLLLHALSQHSERHALVALHHHPIPSGSAWLDQHQLHNHDAFWSVISSFEQVKGVVCGHIHQALDVSYRKTRILAAPSTCIQFLPDSEQFLLDTLNPGWREITLHPDGMISSHVERLSGTDFIPDMTSSGY